MVFLTAKYLLPKRLKRTFVDKVRVFVKGGNGGHGKARYGGTGGRGGHVYVVAEEKTDLRSLIRKFPNKRFVAPSGQDSALRALLGPPGDNVEIPVPPGVCVKNDADETIGELNKPGDRVLVARGGAGGGPGNNFAAQQGHRLSVSLDLKLIADVGLVGFPNAGKSTLLKAVSRASPKIASYPFTTIQPQLGIMEYPDFRKISMADLPGLIEGAHINVGLGHSFLKHVERTRLLLFVVDIHGFQLSYNHPNRTALQTLLLLNKELELYREELVTKPALLAVNKMDVEGADDKFQEFTEALSDIKEGKMQLEEEFQPEQLVHFDDMIPISAKEKDNTENLMTRVRQAIDHHASLEEELAASQVEAKDDTQILLTEHYGRGHI